MAASVYLGAQSIIALDIGLGFAAQDQCLRRIEIRSTGRLAVDQAAQQVQHMGLGRHTLCQGEFHGGQHGLLIMVQDKRKDIDHLAITTGFAQHVILQLFERRR